MHRLVWFRSSVAAPMSELEFDLMGMGYAAGFGRALAAFVGDPVDVLVTRHRGHLYSAITAGTADGRVPLLETTMTSWTEVVLSRLAEHFKLFGELADEPTGPALAEARGLFAECIALHHALLLPARQAITELLGFWLANGVHAARGHDGGITALMCVTPVGTPTFRAAERLVDDGLPETADDSRITELAADGAPDGDGYGLVVPGWLDDPAYPRRMRRFLRRLGVNRRGLRSMRAAAEDRQEAALTRLARACPARLSGELAARLTTAQAGAALAEVHGPIMHARYVHELRRLVTAHGERLAGRGLLREPEDFFHLRLAELGQQATGPHQVDTRRASYLRSSQRPLPRPRRSSPAPGGREPLPTDAAARLTAFSGAAGTRVDARKWQGVGAASGCGQGPLKAIRDQKDLERLEPGDVALVPDAGPAWGWLALAGVPLIIEHGGPLGHAPAVARECGAACVVGGYGLGGLVAEGGVVKVSGDTGEVTW